MLSSGTSLEHIGLSSTLSGQGNVLHKSATEDAPCYYDTVMFDSERVYLAFQESY